jgi:hypothetical protein
MCDFDPGSPCGTKAARGKHGYSRKELETVAKACGITGISKLNMDQLCQELQQLNVSIPDAIEAIEQQRRDIENETKYDTEEETEQICEGGICYIKPQSRKSSTSPRRGRTPRPSSKVSADSENYFFPDSPLSTQQQKYCRASYHIAGKNPEWCQRERAWNQERDGERCYNPWATSHAAVRGAKGRTECAIYTDFDNLPDDEIIAYANYRYEELNDLARGRFPERDPARLRNLLKKWQASKESAPKKRVAKAGRAASSKKKKVRFANKNSYQ